MTPVDKVKAICAALQLSMTAAAAVWILRDQRRARRDRAERARNLAEWAASCQGSGKADGR